MAEEWVGLSLARETAQVAPGAKTQLTLVVRNLSSVVDQYLITIDGLDPTWFTIAEPSVSLFPTDKAPLQLTIHPPQDAPAGPHPFTIRATSSTDPSRQAQLPATLTVGATGGYELTLSPQHASGRSATFRLIVANHANAPTSLSLEGRDAEGALRYNLSQSQITVPANTQVEVPLHVTRLHRKWLGPPILHPFRVVAWPTGETLTEEEMVSTQGELEYPPLLPALPVVPRTPLLLGLAAIPLLLALWLWLQPIISGGNAEPTAVPTPTVATGSGSATPTTAAKAGGEATPTTTAGQPTPGGSAGGNPPVIVEFRADPAPGGDGVILVWVVENAETVQLNGENVKTADDRKVPAEDGKQYELVAKSASGQTAKRRLSLVVLRPPEITSFTAEPQSVPPGGHVILRWNVNNASRASIDDQDAAVPTGERDIVPERSRDYVIIAENAVGWVVARVSVTVQAP